ncbi:MAG: hypothetical protein Q8Q01_00155 [archaeon]|nr:hypothetical protein [archaeon]
MQKLIAGLISSLATLSIASGLGAIYYNPDKNKNEKPYSWQIDSVSLNSVTDEFETDIGLVNDDNENENLPSVNEDLLEVFKETYTDYVNRRKRWRENGAVDSRWSVDSVSGASSWKAPSLRYTSSTGNKCVEDIIGQDGTVVGCYMTKWRPVGEKPKAGVLQIKNYPWEHWWNNYDHKGRLTVYLSPKKTTIIVKGKSDQPIPIEKKEDVEDILRPCFSGNDYDIDNAQRVIEEEGEISNLESAIFIADLLLSCPEIKDHYCEIESHSFEDLCWDTENF